MARFFRRSRGEPDCRPSPHRAEGTRRACPGPRNLRHWIPLWSRATKKPTRCTFAVWRSPWNRHSTSRPSRCSSEPWSSIPAIRPRGLRSAVGSYMESRYGNGNPAMMKRYDAAMERALSLDPNYVAAGAGLIVSRVERGDLVAAHRSATDLVRRRPDTVEAQFVLSYVLRYAGLLDEAGRSSVRRPSCSTAACRRGACGRVPWCSCCAGTTRAP